VTVNNVTGGASISDTAATAVAITGSSKASDIMLPLGAAATSLSFAGDAAVKLVTGTTLGSVTGITSTNTAGVTIIPVLGNGVSFTGGDGKDTVTVGATTKTIDMGKGDDTVVVGVSALGPGGSLKGGDGIDTISMGADNVAAATLTPTFANSIDGFERLDINGSASGAVTVNLANLDNIADVRVSVDVNNALTLNNLATNGTVTWTAGQAVGTSTTINVLGAVSNPNDVINLGISSKVTGIDVKTVIVSNVETVNLNTDDSAATPTGIVHILKLDAAHAKTLTVFGDAGVSLDLTGTSSTALETINTSGVTKGAVSVTTVGTGSVTLIGGDTNTTFNASSVAPNKSATITTGKGDDIIIGGAGDDVINAGNGTNFITGGGGKDIMTGGTGVDTYKYTAVTDSQGSNVDIITNFQVGVGGDKIDLNVLTVGTGAFLGVVNGYGAVLTSLTGTLNTEAVFDASTSTLYIDVNGDGVLNNNDMAIQLAGVTSGLVAANFIF
jgi:S-layer protein